MAPTLQALGINKLSVSERLDLITAIWDTIPDAPRLEDVPDWHLEEIERRLASAEANPAAGIPWEEVKAQLRKPA